MKALTLTDNSFCWWFINESSDTDRQSQNSFASVVLLVVY